MELDGKAFYLVPEYRGGMLYFQIVIWDRPAVGGE